MPGVRYAARVLILEPSGRVLLLRHSRPEDDDHWAPPGGGLEPGETPHEAAHRELREEIGVTGVALQRPMYTWLHRFSYRGVLTLQHETLFAVRLGAPVRVQGAPRNLGEDGIVSARWWSQQELAGCREDIWPHGLVELLPRLLNGDLNPDRPIPLGTGPLVRDV